MKCGLLGRGKKTHFVSVPLRIGSRNSSEENIKQEQQTFKTKQMKKIPKPKQTEKPA